MSRNISAFYSISEREAFERDQLTTATIHHIAVGIHMGNLAAARKVLQDTPEVSLYSFIATCISNDWLSETQLRTFFDLEPAKKTERSWPKYIVIKSDRKNQVYMRHDGAPYIMKFFGRLSTPMTVETGDYTVWGICVSWQWLDDHLDMWEEYKGYKE